MPILIPPFPEAIFQLRNGRSEKLCETDLQLGLNREWMQRAY